MKDNLNSLPGKITRRNFLYKGSAGAIGIPFIPASSIFNSGSSGKELLNPVELTWKNKQPGMVYRQLGRTGFMISEIVNGGTHINSENIRLTEIAIEKGLNYLDTAPAYKRGESETEIGKILASPSKRDKVFLTTKISGFPNFRNNLYKEIFDKLPASKQEALVKKAGEMRNERGVDRTEYLVTYFPGQTRQLDGAFLSNAMMEEYGEKVEGSIEFEKMITESLEASLKRLKTDHVDILMCPHGASNHEELNNPFIKGTFEKLKKQGKVSFLGLSTHNDMANVLRSAINTGYYDVVMLAYNIVNHGFLDELVKEASGKGLGIIAMKVANPIVGPHESLGSPPAWRIDKLNHIVPGDMSPPLKAYLWALQNQHLSAVISEMTTEEMVNENLALAGQKVEFMMA